MKKDCFAKGMTLLQNYYDHQLSNERYSIYWDNLKEISDNEFLLTVNNIINNSDFEPTTKKPFPLLKDFHNNSKGGINRAISVIGHVRRAINVFGRYQSVNFGDKAIHAMIEHYGGWVELCSWAMNEWLIKEKQMIETYLAAKKSGEGSDYVAGLHEITNNDNNPKIENFPLNDIKETVPKIEKKQENLELIEELSKKMSIQLK